MPPSPSFPPHLPTTVPGDRFSEQRQWWVSRRIQDEYNLNDGTKGAQLGEGDLAQGGILRDRVAPLWSTPCQEHHPAPSTQTSLRSQLLSPTPAFLKPSLKDTQSSTCMPRGMAASSMSSSRMWMATMSTERPCGKQGHGLPFLPQPTAILRAEC